MHLYVDLAAEAAVRHNYQDLHADTIIISMTQSWVWVE